MVRVGIIGGAGYTGGELIRILLYHPMVSIASVQSQSHAGKKISSVHRDLLGEINLVFEEKISSDLDVLFLCSGHGQGKSFMDAQHILEKTLVIDLSADFRLDDDWIYGLPETNRTQIQNSNRIANCGCFATAIQLGLYPLTTKNLIQSEIHVTAITGSTGAGQALSTSTHFSWRNNNLSVYKPFTHQHLEEIRRNLNLDLPLTFIPIRGDFTRGILASMTFDSDLSEEELTNIYKESTRDEPFTHFIEENPDLKQVVNTNHCFVYVEKHQQKVLVVSILDNLLKGASGQAVQNMNIRMGFPEKAGLNLKASVF
jgi:N-acetyl-gamma-glutamyl-phosphate reductase